MGTEQNTSLRRLIVIGAYMHGGRMKSKPNTPLSRKLGTDVDQSRKQNYLSKDHGVFESGYQPWLLRKNGLRISPIPYIKALSAWLSSVGAVIHLDTYCSISFCFQWHDLVIFFLVTLIIWAFVNVPENCAIFAVFYKKYWAERWLHPNFEDQRELPKYQSENPISGSMIWETNTLVEFIQILHLCCMKNPLGTSPIFVVPFLAHLFSAKKNSYFFFSKPLKSKIWTLLKNCSLIWPIHVLLRGWLDDLETKPRVELKEGIHIWPEIKLNRHWTAEKLVQMLHLIVFVLSSKQ